MDPRKGRSKGTEGNFTLTHCTMRRERKVMCSKRDSRSSGKKSCCKGTGISWWGFNEKLELKIHNSQEGIIRSSSRLTKLLEHASIRGRNLSKSPSTKDIRRHNVSTVLAFMHLIQEVILVGFV